MDQRRAFVRKRILTPVRGEPEPKPEPEEEKEENDAAALEDAGRLSIMQLRHELETRGLDSSGRKSVLIKRLMDSDGVKPKEDEQEIEPMLDVKVEVEPEEVPQPIYSSRVVPSESEKAPRPPVRRFVRPALKRLPATPTQPKPEPEIEKPEPTPEEVAEFNEAVKREVEEVEVMKLSTARELVKALPSLEEFSDIFRGIVEAQLEQGVTVTLTVHKARQAPSDPPGREWPTTNKVIIPTPKKRGPKPRAAADKPISDAYATFMDVDCGQGKGWRALTIEERYAYAKAQEVFWKRQADGKLDLMQMTRAVLKTLGIKKRD